MKSQVSEIKKGKGKVVPIHAMKAYQGVEV
jgi:hypothetical protein